MEKEKARNGRNVKEEESLVESNRRRKNEENERKESSGKIIIEYENEVWHEKESQKAKWRKAWRKKIANNAQAHKAE